MSPPAATSRTSAYLSALTLEIQKKLQRALASPSQRRNLLQELFADVALEERALVCLTELKWHVFNVDFEKEKWCPWVKSKPEKLWLFDNYCSSIGSAQWMYALTDRLEYIILAGKDIISSSEDETQGPLCFYDVLADYFVREPENGNPVLDLIIQLWSQSFASHIFSLLFHKWLFEVQIDNAEVLLRYSSALVQGATNVFWIDIQTNTRRFQSLFWYLLEEVALVPERLKKIPLQAQRDLFLLLSRFILFYNLADKLESFLKHFPDFPTAFFVGGPADNFVIELTDQLQKLKVEPVLLHYLSQITVLQGQIILIKAAWLISAGMELRMTTSTRLKACLYSFTSPGGPMYPTRVVRHAAWEALDFLFPVGRYPRHLISLFFRLLFPWYWPSSCWNFIMSCVQAVLYYIFSLIFSVWDKLIKPRKS
ncbi:hypothetical protein RHGRI_036407 [Rhododendron griersonianum]|uniref:Uncharacterized protein n=1 Tax=Rhododendron griersonianum TaxID=479676 RepID=A0AAV6HRC3_9ERIC|nr:hypothetical protein RHGRI_036407 [Rhododendron griersonianum]